MVGVGLRVHEHAISYTEITDESAFSVTSSSVITTLMTDITVLEYYISHDNCLTLNAASRIASLALAVMLAAKSTSAQPNPWYAMIP